MLNLFQHLQAKSKARISKLETISNNKNSKRFENLHLENWNLFRISDFGIRILKFVYNDLVVYTVYILRTSSNTLYTGQTNNLEKRLREHKSKSNKSAKYMRGFKSFELVYQETHATLSKALKREIEIKKMSHAKKELLIENKILSSPL